LAQAESGGTLAGSPGGDVAAEFTVRHDLLWMTPGMMSIRVRSVAGIDWEKLKELRLRALAADPDAFGGTYKHAAALPASEWTQRAEVSERGQQSRWFAAVDGDGEWVGIALAATDGAGNARLFGMWVQPQARGSSAAGLLCDACVDWAASRGHETIELSVVVDNARAAALYRKAGFVEVGREVEDFGERSLPVSVMRRSV
jgi:ribosomal protein S18 acetylase RimI-like enzyme